MKNPLKSIITVMTIVIGLAFNSAASAEDAYKLKFQSSDEAGNPNYVIQQEWADRVNQMTNGRITIEMLPVGSIIKHTETLDAISTGVLDGHVTATSYFSGKDPAFGLIGNTVGAWGDPNEMFLFMEHGGGLEILEGLYAPYGVQVIGVSSTGLEAFVSKQPLNGVADLKGLKLRAPEGLVQAVFAAAGAAPVNLPGSEVFTSLDKGVIDAADFTVFSTNHQQGMHKIAKHPVYPGFHSLPVIDVSMNKEIWDSMPGDLKELLKVSVRDFSRQITSKLKLKDQAAVTEAKADSSITVHDWPVEERNNFREIARSQWKVFSEKSPNAKKVYGALNKYLSENGML